MLSRVLQVTFGIVYAVGYLALTLVTIGAGHGTTLLFSGLPTLILFLACVVMLIWADRKEYQVAIGLVMAINYIVTVGLFVAFEAGDSFRYTIKYFESEPELFTFSLVWYLVGQVVFWFIYLRRFRSMSVKLS